MTDYYDEYIKSKQSRRDKKGKKRRNPIASTHGKGRWNAGPMEDKLDRGRKDWKRDMVEDYDNDDLN